MPDQGEEGEVVWPDQGGEQVAVWPGGETGDCLATRQGGGESASSVLHQFFISSSSAIYQQFINSSSVLHHLFISSSSDLHQFFISSSSALHQLFISSSSVLFSSIWLFVAVCCSLWQLFPNFSQKQCNNLRAEGAKADVWRPTIPLTSFQSLLCS